MNYYTDITQFEKAFPTVQAGYELLDEINKEIPGSVSYSIKRIAKTNNFNMEDTGMISYHYEKKSNPGNFLELRFCIAGNMYCNNKGKNCNSCILNDKSNCGQITETIDFLSFRFLPSYLNQFIKTDKKPDSFSDKVLSFNYKNAFSKSLPLCGKTRMVIEAMLNNSFTGIRENIFINAQTQILLLYSMDCMLGEKEDLTFTCKFLANDEDREKILLAREVLLKHIGEPITIKTLSKKVAINECYLKKGFKEIFGTTIFDFYHSQRMEHAKYLLYEKGLSVTEVSSVLGYSSISHFSTAFKKHTGLKPCELLFR